MSRLGSCGVLGPTESADGKCQRNICFLSDPGI
jgi:hypothetical protein